MSVPDIIKGTYVSIAVETTPGSGTYTVLCGLNSHGITYQVNTRDRFLRDCADPESIPARTPVSTGRQWDLTGSGLYNRAQASLIAGLVGLVRNYRFFLGEPADDAVYDSYWQGAAMLTQLGEAASDDDDVTQELTFVSDGIWTLETA